LEQRIGVELLNGIPTILRAGSASKLRTPSIKSSDSKSMSFPLNSVCAGITSRAAPMIVAVSVSWYAPLPIDVIR